jgi:hypothetical protein
VSVPLKDNEVYRVPDEPGISKRKRKTHAGPGLSARRSCPSASIKIY